MKITILLLLASVMILAALDGTAQNLITNGDFSTGNTGFTSGYTFVASGTSATPGIYGIRSSSQNLNPGYNAFADHTTGSGLMLLVDGYTSSTTVWSQTVNVSSNASYVFSGYAISAGGNPATLQFLVNGVQVGANFNLPAVTVPSTPNWNNLSVGWSSTSNTTATLAIVDVNPNWSSPGDDFGLDDLSFSLVILPDLAPVSVSWNNPPVAGQANTLNMVVTNAGNGAASGGWYNQWVLSTTTNTVNAVANGTFEVSYCCFNAPTNGTYATSIGVTLPGVPAGTYYLIAQADDRNYVYESNETNNSLVVAITIGNTDLVATNFSVNALAVAGTNLPVSFTVINNGTNAYSSYWYDSVTLSNATLSVVVTNWEFYGYHSLSSGGNYVQSQLLPLLGVAAGTNYYLIAQTDDRNYVPESNKINNFQVLQVTITNRPPFIALWTPTNIVQQTSCVPVSFTLAAGIQLGSYAITNVTFYDGGTLIGQTTTAPYRTKSQLLDHGSHITQAHAQDKFGLSATSIITATLSVDWPSQTNVLRADAFSNTCVICMTALNGTNYVIETKTNLTSPTWQPLGTNQVSGGLLVFTNQQTVPTRFYRTRY